MIKQAIAKTVLKVIGSAPEVVDRHRRPDEDRTDYQKRVPLQMQPVDPVKKSYLGKDLP